MGLFDKIKNTLLDKSFYMNGLESSNLLAEQNLKIDKFLEDSIDYDCRENFELAESVIFSGIRGNKTALEFQKSSLRHKNNNNMAITDIAIVKDLDSVPLGYDVIDRTEDTGDNPYKFAPFNITIHKSNYGCICYKIGNDDLPICDIKLVKYINYTPVSSSKISPTTNRMVNKHAKAEKISLTENENLVDNPIIGEKSQINCIGEGENSEYKIDKSIDEAINDDINENTATSVSETGHNDNQKTRKSTNSLFDKPKRDDPTTIILNGYTVITRRKDMEDAAIATNRSSDGNTSYSIYLAYRRAENFHDPVVSSIKIYSNPTRFKVRKMTDHHNSDRNFKTADPNLKKANARLYLKNSSFDPDLTSSSAHPHSTSENLNSNCDQRDDEYSIETKSGRNSEQGINTVTSNPILIDVELTTYTTKSPFYIVYQKINRKNDFSVFEGDVISTIPPNYNEHELPALELLPKFCNPDGFSISYLPSNHLEMNRFYYNTFNNVKGDRIYAVTLVYNRRVNYSNKLSTTTHNQWKYKNLEPFITQYMERYCDSDNILVESVAITLLSRLPVYKLHENFLIQIRSMLNQKPGHLASIPLLYRLIAFYMCFVCPPRYRIPRIVVSYGSNSVFRYTYKPCMDLLSSQYCNLHNLVSMFTIEKLATIYCWMLREKKILFHSRNSSKIYPVMDMLRVLFFPFEWACTFLTYCPPEFATITEAPSPFMVGTLTHYLPKFNIPDEVLVVSLDNDRLRSSSRYQDPNTKHIRHFICKNLENFIDWSRKQKFAYHNSIAREDIEKMNTLVLESFIYPMAHVLKDYQKYLKYEAPKNAYDSPIVTIRKDEFIYSRQHYYRDFCRELLDLQFFNTFINRHIELIKSTEKGLFVRKIEFFELYMARVNIVDAETIPTNCSIMDFILKKLPNLSPTNYTFPSIEEPAGEAMERLAQDYELNNDGYFVKNLNRVSISNICTVCNEDLLEVQIFDDHLHESNKPMESIHSNPNKQSCTDSTIETLKPDEDGTFDPEELFSNGLSFPTNTNSMTLDESFTMNNMKNSSNSDIFNDKKALFEAELTKLIQILGTDPAPNTYVGGSVNMVNSVPEAYLSTAYNLTSVKENLIDLSGECSTSVAMPNLINITESDSRSNPALYSETDCNSINFTRADINPKLDNFPTENTSENLNNQSKYESIPNSQNFVNNLSLANSQSPFDLDLAYENPSQYSSNFKTDELVDVSGCHSRKVYVTKQFGTITNYDGIDISLGHESNSISTQNSGNTQTNDFDMLISLNDQKNIQSDKNLDYTPAKISSDNNLQPNKIVDYHHMSSHLDIGNDHTDDFNKLVDSDDETNDHMLDCNPINDNFDLFDIENLEFTRNLEQKSSTDTFESFKSL